MFNKFIAFVSAIYFVFAGAGYNVANYCCDSCRNEGIEHILANECSLEANENDCCEPEPQNRSSFVFEDLNQKHHSNNSCELNRYELDKYTIEETENSDLIISTKYSSEHLIINHLILASNSIANSKIVVFRDLQFGTTGREILKIKQVLII